MFFWNWVGEERDDDHGDEADDEEDDGEVEEVDLSDDGGSELLLTTLGTPVPKVQPHPSSSNHHPDNQSPESALYGQNSYYTYLLII